MKPIDLKATHPRKIERSSPELRWRGWPLFDKCEASKEVAPRITRVAIMFNPDTAPGGGIYFLDSFNAAR